MTINTVEEKCFKLNRETGILTEVPGFESAQFSVRKMLQFMFEPHNDF